MVEFGKRNYRASVSNMGRVTTSAPGSYSSALDGEPRAALYFAQSADANKYHNSGSNFNKTLLANAALLNPSRFFFFLFFKAVLKVNC